MTLVLAVLLMAPLSMVACGDETRDDDLLESRNDDTNDNQNNQTEQETEYEAGLLDGYWELQWNDGGEHFSSFTIVHNLDDDILTGTFDTVGEGTGNIRTINFEPEIAVDEERTPGRMTAEWRPHPDNLDSNEEYTITAAYFDQGTDDRMIGEISAIVGFDIQMFTMERAEPPEVDDEEEHHHDD